MTDGPAEFIASFMDDYFAEAEEHLVAARRGLLVLEDAVGGADPPRGVVEELFRSFHSLKGISAMVELREAEQLAHEMETCLGAIRDRRFGLSAQGFDTLVEGISLLEQVIAARRTGGAIPNVDEHIGRLAARCGAGAPAGRRVGSPGRNAAPAPVDQARAWTVTFVPSPDLVARGIKVDTIRGRLAEAGRIERAVPRVTGEGGVAFEFQVSGVDESTLASWGDDGITYEQAAPGSPVGVDAAGETPRAPLRAVEPSHAPATVVRVDLGRLDDLMRLVGELVVSRARLEDRLVRVEPFVPSAEWRALQQETEGIERQLRELREGVMRVRLVPVAEIFRRMPFVVRDLARDNGKRVRIELSGQGTEIDKFLIERMMDPVLHLVRNAVSHGIEMPDERAAAGKPPEGTIRLTASTLGESAVLEVSDDGGGMDVAAIVGRARAAGVRMPDDADGRAVLDAICAPGFSTRDEADRASGRGIGMAVVRDTVQELGGTLSVETAPGRGTTFRATLPLTLAITDAFIVHVGARVFAVPQAAVDEVVEVEPDAIRAIENHELITHRGLPLPLLRLARLFSIAAAPRPRLHAIVVGGGLAAVGLLVDRISGQREVVVKALHDPLVKVAGVSGATELGDGRLVLILDVGRLVRTAGAAHGAPARAAI